MNEGCPTIGILGQNLTFNIQVATTPTGDVTYDVYSDITATPILSGTMTKDFNSKAGFCVAQIAVTTANGFATFNTYTIRIAYTVASVALSSVYSFLCLGNEVSAATTPSADITADTDIANLALLELSITVIKDITVDGDTEAKCRIILPAARRTVIEQFASMETPFKETLKYADLGAEIAEADRPEMGTWRHAFTLPDDYFAIVGQYRQSECHWRHCDREKYAHDIILNKNGNGKVFLTNDLTNEDHDSAYIEYCIDPTSPSMWSQNLKNCVVTLMCAALTPPLAETKGEKRRNFLLEYEVKVMPNAKTFNLSQEQKRIDRPMNYLGGRRSPSRRWDGYYGY